MALQVDGIEVTVSLEEQSKSGTPPVRVVMCQNDVYQVSIETRRNLKRWRVLPIGSGGPSNLSVITGYAFGDLHFCSTSHYTKVFQKSHTGGEDILFEYSSKDGGNLVNKGATIQMIF